MQLYGHPFSSYTQKALIALYEHAPPFEFRLLGPDPAIAAEHARLWPFRRMPVLVDGGRTLAEATIVVEYLDRTARAARLVPADGEAALEVRFLDRIFDNDVMTPMQKIVLDHLRPADARDPYGVAAAHAQLDTAYAWLDGALRGRPWAAGAAFTLADCAAAPSLFYADWVHPIGAEHATLRSYRARLLQRPSFARCVEEARPYRSFFPPGAPDRD